jgi:hypothetical protein
MRPYSGASVPRSLLNMMCSADCEHQSLFSVSSDTLAIEAVVVHILKATVGDLKTV